MPDPLAHPLVDEGAPLSRPTVAGHPVVVHRGAEDAADATGRATTWGVPLVGHVAGPAGSDGPAPGGARPDGAAPTRTSAIGGGWVREVARARGVVPHVVVLAAGARTPEDLMVAALADVRIVLAPAEAGDLRAADDADAAALVGRVLSFLPPNCLTEPATTPALAPRRDAEDLTELIPAVPDLPFDPTPVLDAVLDPDPLRLGPAETALVTLLARVEGGPCAVVASDPRVRHGMPSPADARRVARFVAFADAFGLPVLTIADVPDALDALPDIDPDAAAALGAAYGETTSGLVTVVLRRGEGATAALLGLPGAGADVTLAWPACERVPDAALTIRPERTRVEVAAALRRARTRRDSPTPRRGTVWPR